VARGAFGKIRIIRTIKLGITPDLGSISDFGQEKGFRGVVPHRRRDVALMVQELCPQPHHRVLDVGAGSGYQTAILARLVSHVYAVERINELTEHAIDALAGTGCDNVTVVTADGTLGLPEEAPYDGIICGAAAPDVPQSWLSQLTDGGRIVLPVGGRDEQTLVAIQRNGETFTRREVCRVRFVKLIGEHGWRPPE